MVLSKLSQYLYLGHRIKLDKAVPTADGANRSQYLYLGHRIKQLDNQMNGKISRLELFYNPFIVKKKEEFSQMYASEIRHFTHF